MSHSPAILGRSVALPPRSGTTVSATPLRAVRPLLQRRCACGSATSAGGECEECRRKRERSVQRWPASSGTGALRDFSRVPGQTSLSIVSKDDPSEHEAEQIADAIMQSVPLPQPDLQKATPSPGERDSEMRVEPAPIQRKADSNAGLSAAAPPIVHEVLSSPGEPIETETRAMMEHRFGRDFSQVRIHRDARAGDSARAVDALAYTVGSDIVLGPGQAPGHDPASQRLLAHELAHVVQQTDPAPLAAPAPANAGQP